MRQDSNMEFEVTPLNNDTDCKGKRRDKKQRLLRYLVEGDENRPCDLHNHEDNSFPPLPALEQQNYAEGSKTTDFYNDLRSDSFSPSHQMGFKTESIGSPYFDSPAYGASNDYLGRFGSLKLESDPSPNYSPSHTLSRRKIKDEPLHSSDSLGFQHTPDISLHSHDSHDYYNSSLQANYSSFEDSPLQYHDQTDYYSGINSEFGFGNSFPQSPFDYSPKDESWPYDEDEPLDLSTSKREDSPHADVPYFGDYGSAGDFPLKEENNEENSWLKKIKTGTRSRVRSPKSWEFLLRLLMDSRSNPSMIKWEDERSGTFRLVQKDEIAKIWGMRSNKHKDGGLSYDNFARNLRYHYKTKMLVPVSEKHLVYRFSKEVMDKRSSIVN